MIAIYCRVVNHRKLAFFSPLALEKNCLKATQYKPPSFPSQPLSPPPPAPSCGFFFLDHLSEHLQFGQPRIVPSYGVVFVGCAEPFVFCTRARESNDANRPDPGCQKYKYVDLQREPPCPRPLGRGKWTMKQFAASESLGYHERL